MPDLLPTDFASGCAMLVRSSVFEQIGLLDPSLIMYGEEVDFCWRVRKVGYKIACSTKATLWHKVSTSAKKDQPNSRYLKARNQIRFYRNYSKGIQIHHDLFLFSNLSLVIHVYSMTSLT
jgi:GT2 family glycosyltransferase